MFYEVLLHSFFDSNDDGTGDFEGLRQKLDYLAWLGVDALWIPPFYPSPMADGGYDIADYTSVDPRYGGMEDFNRLVEEAHDRGIRIVIDMVMNHTSDQHPWFQASRNDPTGPYGDFYVWRDRPSEYLDARIIFIDTEDSNWSDEVRGQYYWHRFFSHQPDLNFENPAVREAIKNVLRYWADTGVDGFRLDAIPYLYEQDGTNCENLPPTHDFISELRQMVDEEYPGTVLIAEANQPPHEVVAYFGTDAEPECHICFHFPIMPKIFAALREETSRGVREFAVTPPLPRAASGNVPTEPRRADFGNGDGGRAPGNVAGTPRTEDEIERRNPAPPHAAATRFATRGRAGTRPAPVARVLRSCTTATKSEWATFG